MGTRTRSKAKPASRTTAVTIPAVGLADQQERPPQPPLQRVMPGQRPAVRHRRDAPLAKSDDDRADKGRLAGQVLAVNENARGAVTRREYSR